MSAIITAAAAWLGTSAAVGLGLGALINHGKKNAPGITDDELLAAQAAQLTAPEKGTQIVTIEGPHHRLLINWNQHTLSRVRQGQRTELPWPIALTPAPTNG